MKHKKNYHVWLGISIILIISTIISCIYEDVNYILTMQTDGYGITEPARTLEVLSGKPQNISAIPNPNYYFTGWEIISGKGVSFGDKNKAQTTVTLYEENATIKANFNEAVTPVGIFIINNDNDNTISTSVTLTMAISNAVQMRFGNTPGELNTAPWESYVVSKTWTLSSGIAYKTVYGEFRNSTGTSYQTSDTIRVIKKITASDGAASDYFGKSVAMSADGSTIVVSAYGDDDNGELSGSVYVYNGINWSTETKITPSDGDERDLFANYDIAISSDGSTIVVGNRNMSYNEPSGYVYVYNGTNWGTEKKISLKTYTLDFAYNHSIAMSADGSTIVVGSYDVESTGGERGSVCVFYGTNWSTYKTIFPGDSPNTTGYGSYAADRFGSTVAISSDAGTIIVGSKGDDDNGEQSGSIYVYNGTNWGVETRITPHDSTAFDRFGCHVAVSSNGSTIVVGANGDDDNGSQSGSVYIFNGTNWGTEKKITPQDGTTNKYFGSSVSLSLDGSTIIVGAYGDNANGSLSGAIYTYRGTNWGIEKKIIPSDGAAGDNFGFSIAGSFAGSTIVAGAYSDTDNGTDSGSVYIIPME